MLRTYKKRLQRDIDRWHGNGWVSDLGRRSILDDVARNGREISLAPALAILASVLFGFAAISFVAAHWNDVPRLGRMGLLFASIWAGYGVAGWLNAREHTAFADAAILFSVAMFGASIMLISQMYNISGEPADGVLMWWIGALLAGVLLQSNPALALAMVLVVTWAGMHTINDGNIYWPFLIGWGLVAAAFLWHRWRPGLHLAAFGLAGFVISAGYLPGENQQAIVTAIGIAVAAAAIAVERMRPDFDYLADPILAYGVAVAFAGLFAMQFIESPTKTELLCLAVLTLAMLLTVISHSVASGNRGALWIGYVAFSIEILGVYWQTIGTILNTSVFFLMAALIVTALAYMALKLAQRNRNQDASA